MPHHRRELLPGADTVAGLDSAIRADFARWCSQCSYSELLRLDQVSAASTPDVPIGREFGEWCATVALPGDDKYDIGHLHTPMNVRDLLDELDDLLDRPG